MDERRVFAWDITSNCNLRCKHCYNWGLVEKRECKDEMTLEECYKFIDKLPSNAHLHLLGGEPLMKKDFIEIIKYIKAKNITYSMVTNGLLLKDKMLEEVLNSTVNNVAFSFDGTNKEIHEQIRGKNTFDRLIENIKSFKKGLKDNEIENIGVSVNFTVSNLNYRYIEELYKLLSDLGITYVSVNRMQQEGNALNNNLNITDEEWIETCQEVTINAKKFNIRTRLNGKPLLLSYLNTKYGYDYDLDILKCSIKNDGIAMYVKNDGEIFACNKWYLVDDEDKENLNISQMEKEDLLSYSTNNILYKKVMNIYEKSSEYRDDFCLNCNYQNYCDGCIFEFNSSNKLVKDTNECKKVYSKMVDYSKSLTIDKFQLRGGLEYDFLEDGVNIKDTVLEREITLKGPMKQVIMALHMQDVNEVKDIKNIGDYLYAIKGVGLIECKSNKGGEADEEHIK